MGGISPDAAWQWAKESVPFVSMPSLPHVEKTYYYRWKVFLEHIRETQCRGAPVAISECRLATTRTARSLVDGRVETDHQGAKLSEDGAYGCVWGDDVGVITAALGHHVAEGRWLRDKSITESYLRYSYREDRTESFGGVQPAAATIAALAEMRKENPEELESCPKPYQRAVLRTYSAWPIVAVWQKFLCDHDLDLVRALLPKLILDFRIERQRKRADLGRSGRDGFCSDGPPGSPVNHSARHKSCTPGVPACYWITDNKDAMEGSVSGAGCRPSLHAIMFGEAASLAKMIRAVLAAATGAETKSVRRGREKPGANEFFRGKVTSKPNS